MKRIDVKSLALGMMLGAAAFFAVGATTDRSGRSEYRVIAGAIFEGSFERSLSKAAEEGWKFESTAPFTDRHAYAVMSRLKQ